MIAVTAVYRAGMIWQIQRYHKLIIAIIVDMTSNLIYLNCIWLSGISYSSQCDLSVGGTLMYSCACSIKTIPFMLAKFLLTKFTVDATAFLSWCKKLMYSSPISQRSLFLYLFRTSRLKYIHCSRSVIGCFTSRLYHLQLLFNIIILGCFDKKTWAI